MLATELQATSIGLTINEIMKKTESSRKTVERMLSGLYEIGLEAKPLHIEGDHHLTKRWRIEGGLPPELLQLESHELSSIQRHLKSLPNSPESRALKKLLARQPSLGKALAINTAELIDRTSHINQIGPKVQIDESMMATIENAILGLQIIKIKYRSLGQKRASWRIVEPLGLLFGRFGYLVANNVKIGRKPLTYRLDLIEKTKKDFQKGIFKVPENWNFKTWCKESFGVFHGDNIIDVRLRFKGESGKRAKKVTFHPSQKIHKDKDGSIIIRLRCRGHLELCHELSHPDWLNNIIIESPYELKIKYHEYLKQLKKAIIP